MAAGSGRYEVFVVGGHGYVGSRVTSVAQAAGEAVTVVSRTGDTRQGVPSLAWEGLDERLARSGGADAVVWLLDGAKHDELARLRELLSSAPPGTHMVFVSTCTVYGDKGGAVCDEGQALDVRTDHARLKAECEQLLARSGLTWCVQRLGALYGVDDRGVRADRVEKWVAQAATVGVVTVPDPRHWRGWVHRDQASRALWRAAQDRVQGVFNVASANFTFGEAAELAACGFGARVTGQGTVDPCDYRVDSTHARSVGLLDELPREDLAAVVEDFTRDHYPHVRVASRER